MHANTIQKYKGKTLPQLEKLAVKKFNLFIRLRDTDDNGYGYCISSGKPLKVPSKNAHAGHFFPAGSFKRLRFDEDNVHLQSLQDNYFKHSAGASYVINLQKKIGQERLTRLNQLSVNKTPYKRDRFDYIDIIETYDKKARELAKSKMFKVKF